MSAERVKIEQVVPVAVDCSDVFRRIPLDIRVGYEARIVSILEVAEGMCNGRWNSVRLLDVIDYLGKNRGPDGRHQYHSIAEDIAAGGYALINGANQALKKVTQTSLSMLGHGVVSRADLELRRQGKLLALGEMPRAFRGGIRSRS